MDSEHRHELKENDLAVAIGSLKEWWGKHQMKVLGGAVVLAALILAVRWFSASAFQSRDGEQYVLATAPTPEDYRSLARDASSDAVRVHANLRGADAVLPMLRKPVGTGTDAITADKKKQLMDLADGMYKSVLAETKQPLLLISAHMGLAAIAETRGDWAKAKEHYQAVQKLPGEGLDYHKHRAAAFEAALPRIQVAPIWGKEVKETPLTGKDGEKLPSFLDPPKDGKLPSFLDPPKDGKDGETKDGKGGLLFPELPTKDAPAKDGKAPVTPDPTKDAKPADPTKDAKAPDKDAPAKDSPAKDAK